MKTNYRARLRENYEKALADLDAIERRAASRACSSDDYVTPDPYAEGLKALRASAAKAAPSATTAQPMIVDADGMPDPYAAGLARMRSEGR